MKKLLLSYLEEKSKNAGNDLNWKVISMPEIPEFSITSIYCVDEDILEYLRNNQFNIVYSDSVGFMVIKT